MPVLVSTRETSAPTLNRWVGEVDTGRLRVGSWLGMVKEGRESVGVRRWELAFILACRAGAKVVADSSIVSERLGDSI